MGPQLEAIQKQKSSFRLRKIDIKDWDSKVARQHNIRSLPALVMYNGTKLVSSDTREVISLLNKMSAE